MQRDIAQLETQVKSRVVRALFEVNKRGLIVNVVFSAFLCLVLADVVERINLIVWFCAMLISQLIRYLMNVAYSRTQTASSLETANPAGNPALLNQNVLDGDLQRWRNLFAVGAVLTGLLWGLGGIFLFPEQPPYQLVVGVVILGVVASAVAFLSYVPAIYMAYMLLAVVPFSLMMAWQGVPYLYLGVMAMPYMVFLMLASLHICRTITSSIRFSLDNEQLARSLIMEKRNAEKSNFAKSEFLSRMSHEIRTPMNSILGYAQMIEMGTLDEQGRKEGVREIINSGQYLLQLINDVLDLNVIEAGAVKLSILDHKLNTLVDECVALLAPAARDKRVRLINTMAGKNYYVRVDYNRAKQVLLNLLTNAIKYNKENGEVRVACGKRDNGLIRITVSDTGPGLTDIEKEQLFIPFQRVGDHDSEGIGIGLVITKRLVKMMGGEIGLDTKFGLGSHFWVEFHEGMVAAEKFSDQPQKRAVPKPEDTVNREATILYIEDNHANLKLVKQIIEKQTRFAIITASDGIKGLQMAKKYRPQLILLDLNLPGMDGYEVFRQLKRDERCAGIPVVVVSASAMKADVKRNEELGFDGFLTKPINVGEFVALLNKLLKITPVVT